MSDPVEPSEEPRNWFAQAMNRQVEAPSESREREVSEEQEAVCGYLVKGERCMREPGHGGIHGPWETYHPIDDAAASLLYRLSEQTEDVVDEACAELWPDGDEDWWSPPLNHPELPRHSFSEHVYAAVMRRLAELIKAAGLAAERRAGPNPVDWSQGRICLQKQDARDAGMFP